MYLYSISRDAILSLFVVVICPTQSADVEMEEHNMSEKLILISFDIDYVLESNNALYIGKLNGNFEIKSSVRNCATHEAFQRCG